MSNSNITTHPGLSTAAAAKVFFALSFLSIPATVSVIPKVMEGQILPAPKTTTWGPMFERLGLLQEPNVARATWGNAVDIVFQGQGDEPQRATTFREKLIGEIRRYALLNANWDGEGAVAPNASSLKEAVAFARMLGDIPPLPEPMLLGSGHAGLFWEGEGLYADLEFLGDGRIAYFIKHEEDRHKGVLHFDLEKMPAVFAALLKA